MLDKGADANARVKMKVWYSGYSFDLSGIDEIGASVFWRAAYARETDPARQKELAMAVQDRIMDQGTYIVIGAKVAALDRGIAGLGVGLAVGAVVIAPFGAPQSGPAWSQPSLSFR